jgi:hypothetical protein
MFKLFLNENLPSLFFFCPLHQTIPAEAGQLPDASTVLVNNYIGFSILLLSKSLTVSVT